MHKKKIKVNPVDQVLQVLIYLIIIALCLIILLPCLNVVALAFNDGADAARGGVWFWALTCLLPTKPGFCSISGRSNA